ncbi:hypothetical protein [Mycoplasma sp. 4423]
MSFKSKLLKSLLISTPIFTAIAVSCSNKKDYSETVSTDTPYLMDLLRLKQVQQGIVMNNSELFDQFIDKNKISTTPIYFSKPTLIKSKSEFNDTVINVINQTYQKFHMQKLLSDNDILQIFEKDFLNNQSLENVLNDNNILIYQDGDLFGTEYLEYLIFDHISSNKVSILKTTTGMDLPVWTALSPYLPIFTVLKIPKNKDYTITELDKTQQKVLKKRLYYELNYKFTDFIVRESFESLTNLINNIQIKQSINSKKILFLGDLTNRSLSNIEQTKQPLIINTTEEFNQKILLPLLNTAKEQSSNLTPLNIKNNFEELFLSGKKIENVLRKNKLIVHISKSLGQILNWNFPNHLVINKEKNNKVHISYVSQRTFNFNFSKYDFFSIPNASEQKVSLVYEVFFVPKDNEVLFDGEMNYKQANDFLVLQKKY